eukprot:scaffold5278_cov128-Amphora_coffeaeformis.AAC.7
MELQFPLDASAAVGSTATTAARHSYIGVFPLVASHDTRTTRTSPCGSDALFGRVWQNYLARQMGGAFSTPRRLWNPFPLARDWEHINFAIYLPNLILLVPLFPLASVTIIRLTWTWQLGGNIAALRQTLPLSIRRNCTRLLPFTTLEPRHSTPMKKNARTRTNGGLPVCPRFEAFLNLERINILKMDCVGCEYSLARDIIVEDPDFLYRVDQLSLEVHVSKEWLNNNESLYYFALIFKMLQDAGLKLQTSLIASCSKYHEAAGCMDELKSISYPCGIKRSCHDYLFARTWRQHWALSNKSRPMETLILTVLRLGFCNINTLKITILRLGFCNI